MAFDWKGTIGTVAPWLAGLVGSPAAGIAVSAICNAVGLEPTPENAQKAAEDLAAGKLTGDQLVALKKNEADAQAQLLKLNMDFDVQKDALVFKDRDSARARQTALKDKTPNYLVWTALAVWALMNGTLMFAAYHGHSLPTDMVAILQRPLGTLDALLGAGFAFFLGASPNDAATKQMLYNSTPTDGSAAK